MSCDPILSNNYMQAPSRRSRCGTAQAIAGCTTRELKRERTEVQEQLLNDERMPMLMNGRTGGRAAQSCLKKRRVVLRRKGRLRGSTSADRLESQTHSHNLAASVAELCKDSWTTIPTREVPAMMHLRQLRLQSQQSPLREKGCYHLSHLRRRLLQLRQRQTNGSFLSLSLIATLFLTEGI